MDTQEAASSLTQLLREGRLIALVGSGVSASYTDSAGRHFSGLPTPSEFVQEVSATRTYLAEDASFEDACSAISGREGRATLENILVSQYRRNRGIDIPQAHQVLSWLPFTAYVTSNFDQMLEWQLEHEGRRTSVIVDNADLGRSGNVYTPVIKYHGCVSRPGTMIAAHGDYTRLAGGTSLVRDLAKVTLAKSNLLVIGHGLKDIDLVRIIDELLDGLGHDYLPTVYVVREPNAMKDELPTRYRHELIFDDLTRFLSRLLHQHRSVEPGNMIDLPIFDESWLDSPFFTQIRRVSVLPTETQVIDAFLEHLEQEFVVRTDVSAVIDDARNAVGRALAERPNYEALHRTWSGLQKGLDAAVDIEAAEMVVRSLIEERQSKEVMFKAVGREHIKRGDRILIYSQSQRVMQALDGVALNVQRTVDIFVAECRPKSPLPYDDATAIARRLANTHFNVTICPDVVAINLLSSGQIDKIVMGTHAVYAENGKPYAFVNTCGSMAVALAGEKYGIPTIVVAEEIKVKEVPERDAVDQMHSHQERDLLQAVTGIEELQTRRTPVGHLNIGYDLVPVNDYVTVEIADGLASA